MKNRVLLISIMIISFLSVFPGLSVAGMGDIESFTYTGLNQDLLGKNGSYTPDGSPDGMFHVSISGVGAIAGFSIRSQEGGKVWDSAPDSGQWSLLVIDSRGKKLNEGGGFSIIPFLLSSEFDLYIADDGHLISKTDTYILEVKYIDGSSSSSKVVIESSSGGASGIQDLSGFERSIEARLTGFSETDLAGPNEILAPDGARDVRVKMKIWQSGVITSITIKSRTGRFSIWDTEPSNGKWSIVVVKDGEIRNSTDGSIFLQVSEGTELDMFFADNGSVKAGDTTYEVIVVYKNGRRDSAPLRSEGEALEEKKPFTALLYGKSGVESKPGIPDILTFENDYTSASEKISGNGEPDWGIQLRVNMVTSIISFKIENIDGEYGIWDTLPQNGKWLVVVTDEYGKILNENNGSVDLKITSPVTLWLWFTDTGAMGRGKTRYQVGIMTGKGETYSVPLEKYSPMVSVWKPEIIKVEPQPVFKARYLGVGDKDFVGRYDRLKSDGSRDTKLRIFLDKLDSRIDEIVMKDTKGKNLVWDTIAGNKRWSIMVTTSGGTPLNSTDGSVSIPVKGPKTLNLWVEDNGNLKKGDIPFEIQLKLKDGRILKTSILR